jgi:hypothetical protein
MSEKIFPIEECMEYDEFTDRVELLRELETWIKPRGANAGIGFCGDHDLKKKGGRLCFYAFF